MIESYEFKIVIIFGNYQGDLERRGVVFSVGVEGGHHVEKDKDELPISDEEIGADVAAHSETIE